MKRLPIPLEALAQHVIALGKTRSGKSSKLRLIVEQLLDANKPVCIIDPKGDWWGLKSSADGKSAGYAVVIFGGEHSDVPINEHAGAHIAELVATGNRPCIIDLGGWMVGARTRFFIDFASTLFKLTRGERFLAIDEVHNFCPKGKVLSPEAGVSLHWANRLASEGQGKGLVLVAASQRPQKVHNDFLTSCETLIACRVIHKADRDAIKDWIDGCADASKGREVLAELAQMKRPEAWVWSPEIDFGPKRISFPMFSTYDSYKPQRADAAKLKGWAEVDLDDVRAKLSAVVKQAEANDPTALKKRIAELERQVRQGVKPAAAPPAPSPEQLAKAEQRGYQGALKAALQSAVAWRRNLHAEIRKLLETDIIVLDAARTENPKAPLERTARIAGDSPRIKPERALAVPAARQIDVRASSSSEVNKPMPRAFLTALAQHHEGLSKGQILVHTGYRSSGPVSACFAELARNGWVDAKGPGLRITPEGLQALGSFQPLPTGEDLRRHLLNGSKCSRMEKRMLEVLFDAHPDSIAKGRILERAGYASSGPVSAAFARLVALGYATQSGRGELRASHDLFE